MKKYLVAVFLGIGAISFSQENFNNMGEIHSKILGNRGMEQFHKNIIFNKMGRAGLSGSNQYLEYIGEVEGEYDGNKIDYDSKTKGFMMGTNSNLVKNENIYLGVNLGYLKSKLDYAKEGAKVRTYGIDYYAGRLIDNFLIVGRAGYTESKNIYDEYKYRSRNYSLGVEGGYFFTFKNLKYKNIFYPYIGVDFTKNSIKEHGNIDKNSDEFTTGVAGLTYAMELGKKILFTTSAEYNYDFNNRDDVKLIDGSKIKNMDVGKNSGIFNAKIGYYVNPDFLVSVGYGAILNSKYYYDMVSFTLSHNF